MRTQKDDGQSLNAIMIKIGPCSEGVLETLKNVSRSKAALDMYMHFLQNPHTSYTMKYLEKELNMPEATIYRAKRVLLDLELIRFTGYGERPKATIRWNGEDELVDVGGPSPSLYILNLF